MHHFRTFRLELYELQVMLVQLFNHTNRALRPIEVLESFRAADLLKFKIKKSVKIPRGRNLSVTSFHYE